MDEVYVRSEPSALEVIMDFTLPAPPRDCWRAWTENLDSWWLKELHVTTPPSVFTLEAHAGGGLYERSETGEKYLWYAVSYVEEGKRLVLIEHTTPHAGPLTVQLDIAFNQEPQNRTQLVLSMYCFGCLYTELEEQIRDAWDRLINAGLVPYLRERSIARNT